MLCTCISRMSSLQELLAQEKGRASSSVNEEFDLDELMDVSGE